MELTGRLEVVGDGVWGGLCYITLSQSSSRPTTCNNNNIARMDGIANRPEMFLKLFFTHDPKALNVGGVQPVEKKKPAML